MATEIQELDADLIEWVTRQPMFFVGSAPTAGGHVNVSPKGYDTFRVLGPRRVAYLDLTGSGAETIAHVRQNGRLTIMFCAFEGPPRILRLFGLAATHLRSSGPFEQLAPRFAAVPGARAIVEVELDRIQSSCGFAVPFMDHAQERPTLQQWSRRQGEDGLAAYRSERNASSIDGLPAIDPAP